MSRIEDIRKRAEKATKGPWEWRSHAIDSNAPDKFSTIYGARNFSFPIIADMNTANENHVGNAEFTTHAPEDIAHLLSMLDRANTLIPWILTMVPQPCELRKNAEAWLGEFKR